MGRVATIQSVTRRFRPGALLTSAKATTVRYLRAQDAAITAVSRVLWTARTLLVLAAGILCIAVGAALVYLPAGVIAFGALLLVVAWPEKPTKDET